MQVAIVTGEHSGDLHAASLTRAITSLDASVEVFGLGGPEVRAAGAEVSGDLTQYALMGFIEPIRHYAALLAIQNDFVRLLTRRSPDVLVLIDYPGFNLRLADRASSMGIPVVYYMPPQLWAWGASRVKVLQRAVRKVIVGLPFEQAFYRRHGIDAVYVGHPMVDRLHACTLSHRQANENGHAPMIAMLPGSRRQEVARHWPVMRDAFQLVKSRSGMTPTGTVAVSPTIHWQNQDRGEWSVNEDSPYDVLQGASLALVASGTATLEAAYFGTPMIVVYKMSWPSYAIARALVRVPYISLVNLIAQAPVVPELVQHHATPSRISEWAERLLTHEDQCQAMRERLKGVAGQLGVPGVAMRVAKEVLSVR